VPDLPWTDLAKAQMRREPRGAVAIGPVAAHAISGRTAFKKCVELGVGRYLARRPRLAQSAGPIRLRRLKTPAFDAVAGKGRPRMPPFRRGQGFRRIAQGLHPPPEWREDPQSPAFLGPDRGGRHQKIAGKALRRDADFLERGGSLIGDGLMRSLRHLI